MAKLVAAAPLAPGYFDVFLFVQAPGETTSFTATSETSTFTFTGTGFTYDVSGVLAGTVKTFSEAGFALSGLSLPVTSLEGFASGFIKASEIVATAFSGNDSFTGSAGNDMFDGLAGADTLSGGTGDDMLLGGAGDDSLAGGEGNDVFDGGAGADRMVGGDGNDIFLVRQAGDVVSESSAGGHDTLLSYVSRLLGNNQEDLLLFGTGAIDGTGNGTPNLVVGTPAANVLTGAGGNDTLIGGGATDALDGGPGNDLLFGQAPFALEAVELTQTARSYVNTRANSLANGLGGTAGFGENVLPDDPERDDLSSDAVDLTGVFGPDGLNFFGVLHTSLYVNTNGNVTFDAPLAQFTADPISAGTLPIIAPFWADVDLRPASATAADHVYWDVDTVNKVVTVTWNEVGRYEEHASPANSFQLQLVYAGGSDFDIVFRYASINWTAGDDIIGAGTVAGTVARAGYSAGNGVSYVELAQSGDEQDMLALDTTAGNSGRTGTYVFNVRNGNVIAADDGASDSLLGGAGNDTLDGGAGADRLDGGAGKDSLTGGTGKDEFVLADAAYADAIADFAPGKDKILLDNSVFTALVADGAALGTTFRKGAGVNAAQDSDDRIVYNTTSGKLYYDEDGAGGVAPVLIATLAQSPNTLAATDFLVT